MGLQEGVICKHVSERKSILGLLEFLFESLCIFEVKTWEAFFEGTAWFISGERFENFLIRGGRDLRDFYGFFEFFIDDKDFEKS